MFGRQFFLARKSRFSEKASFDPEMAFLPYTYNCVLQLLSFSILI